MRKSRGKTRNNQRILRNFRGSLVSGALAISLGERFTDAIRREFSPLRNARKILARAAMASERAVDNWLAGTNSPQLDQVILLAASCDALRDELYRLIEEAKASTDKN